MPWLPVKKIRRQFKLLILLVLLTSAVWVTYLHISLTKQGKTLRLPFVYSKGKLCATKELIEGLLPDNCAHVNKPDGERVEGTDPARKPGKIRFSTSHLQAGDSSEELPTLNALGWGRGQRLHTNIEEANLTDAPLPWDNKFKGKVNLHVFEDWCGGAVKHLKTNLHFPLYPHTRTTVAKLAVSPKWKNYGLRIFGYIHPYKDGDYQFAVASEDNSEFWLSTEESPSSAQLLAYVGRVGSEWTAPGEFTKFSSQMSKPLRLMSSRRYYFELLHKQDDRGSDHVEVACSAPKQSDTNLCSQPYSLVKQPCPLVLFSNDAFSYRKHSSAFEWRLALPGMKFEIVDSPYLSLYTDETSFKMNEVLHIPRTLSSIRSHHFTLVQEEPAVDILRPDPRDTFYMTPMIEQSRVENVLVPCAYNPTYVVKDFPIARYQGLQFVYLTFVYPNDFTRLTHMETENKCFYRESPMYLEKFGFYKYMKMDDDESPQIPFLFFNRHFLDDDEDEDKTLLAAMSLKKNKAGTSEPVSPRAEGQRNNNILYNDSQESLPVINDSTRNLLKTRTLLWAHRESPPASYRGHRKKLMPLLGRQEMDNEPVSTSRTSTFKANFDFRVKERKTDSKNKTRVRLKGEQAIVKSRQVNVEEQVIYAKPDVKVKDEKEEARPSEESKLEVPITEGNAKQTSKVKLVSANKHETDKVYVTRLLSGVRKTRGQVFPGMLLPKPKPRRTSRLHDRPYAPTPPKFSLGGRGSKPWTPPDTSELRLFSWEGQTEDPGMPITTSPSLPGGPPLSISSESPPEELQDYSYEETEPRQMWPEDAINWQRTFSVGNVDFEMLRSDWNDLRCNVSGNLQLSEAETVDVVAQYMEKLNEKNGGIYTLLRIVNVEKRRDSARGNRYLIELELEERGRRKVRLAEYVYLLLHRGTGGDSDESPPAEQPEVSTSPPIYTKPILCQPISLTWNPRATVYFVVPVKNQARWVQQLIDDLEFLYLKTRDDQFSLILVDYDSDDMDVEKALRQAKLPSYQYLKRSGNFERAAGLQAGVDTIQDNHSIVFLCDLHVHFPLSVLDSVRKHCVEGRLAFAPIVMRLSCGSSPINPKGYWEVNGFGLFGIYKSDFDRIGGMNTEEFKDRWGGEDWELLDRVLQNGLEVERLRLRNFFHYYHSKRGMWNTQSQETVAKD